MNAIAREILNLIAAGQDAKADRLFTDAVDQLHMARYPDGCPSRCAACVARLACPVCGEVSASVGRVCACVEVGQ